MATHSSILTWRTPWTDEPGGLWSIGSQSQTRLKRLRMHATALCISWALLYIRCFLNVGRKKTQEQEYL